MCPIGNDKEKADYRIDKLSDKLSRTHLHFKTQVPAFRILVDWADFGQAFFNLGLLVVDVNLQKCRDESEDKIEDQPDVDVLQVVRAGKAVVHRDVQGGQDHHDGQVGRYDCVKDLISVTEVVGRLAQHVQEDCRKVGAHDNAKEVALIGNLKVKPNIFFAQGDVSNGEAADLLCAGVVDKFVKRENFDKFSYRNVREDF